MSQGNVDVVRAAWAAISRPDIPAFLGFLHEDIEVIPFGAAMEGKCYRGHAGVREWYERELDVNWEVFEVHPEEFREVGDRGERVVVFGHWFARGRTSGVELNVPATWIVDLRGGRIVRWQTYTDRDEALEAAGLEE
jgi:ketosteroid isomerase-like protein